MTIANSNAINSNMKELGKPKKKKKKSHTPFTPNRRWKPFITLSKKFRVTER